ncbi:hypothetical protein B1759_10650 [Rubrivirga sp. SAORIC476]|uniref:PIG-L deacetylase family protein n=1 Tax=Rubrivirga sp. SAORIC476 TaxID=1961794 RepID=UPI000BA8EE9B|nr:PIG-L deacetylase family protein [Rubrivirga sp. SAORIC476]PAP81743.1 hypothetical protein B1759_10650 [Rubrivirga sp. SAORIC476]
MSSLLIDPERHPLRPGDSVRTLGRTVVLAPHPDDESLGCGGLLARLAAHGVPARVVVVTDGAQSHPGSAAYPPERLRALREAEARAAVAALGVDDIVFLGHPDCGLPVPGSAPFEAAAERLAEALGRAETVLVPWRRDPHCDHVGTWALAAAAATRLDDPPRWIEYPVWAWPHADGEEAPHEGEARAWRLDIGAVLPAKRRAIAAHRSQTGLITDDPDGFRLAPDMLAFFDRSWELFLEPGRPVTATDPHAHA